MVMRVCVCANVCDSERVRDGEGFVRVKEEKLEYNSVHFVHFFL